MGYTKAHLLGYVDCNFVSQDYDIMAIEVNKPPIEDLIKTFFKRGGTIDKFYLRDLNRGKRSLVHLNGWHSGSNIREAILKALDGHK